MCLENTEYILCQPERASSTLVSTMSSVVKVIYITSELLTSGSNWISHSHCIFVVPQCAHLVDSPVDTLRAVCHVARCAVLGNK